MGFQMVHFSNKMDDILREKRVVQGLTQQQVADRAKISLRQYQSFESGERNIRTASFQLAWRVIEDLGMDPTKFFHGDYVIGEEVLLGGDGLRYAKTGKNINEDVE